MIHVSTAVDTVMYSFRSEYGQVEFFSQAADGPNVVGMVMCDQYTYDIAFDGELMIFEGFGNAS